MVKTRTNFENSDDENDESIALRRTRRQQKMSADQNFYRHSEKMNGCEGSSSGRSAISKHESDDSFQPRRNLRDRGRRSINSHLRHYVIRNDVVVIGKRKRISSSSQQNVRRSNRQRKTLYNSMNESAIESAPYHERPDPDLYYTPPISLNNHSPDDDDNEKTKKKIKPELKRLGAVATTSDIESDMYSRVKQSRRKMNTDAGAVADTEETEEASCNEIVTKRRRRRPIIQDSGSSDSESNTESASEEILESRGPTKYCLRPKRAVTQKELPEQVNSTHGPRNRYHFRHRRHRLSFQSPVMLNHRRHRFAHNSSDSSSDETHFERRKSENMMRARSRCLPMNFEAKDSLKGLLRDRQSVGTSLADIDPMEIDRSILFDSIGGLDEHIKSLKEMVLFPLLYPEVFTKYKIQPPRGVLFHGPPGTGKTLVARALANECSQGDRKVAFFMRKGADCLSKWVGESERQLRLLFDQAYLMRPSIIFFDEIDGIAPVRSTRQDQIHSSIVSTLLALMDGLDNRGEVIIIGATNRIEAIDPALRRPGRFDREFYFPLPSLKSRKNILTIHTKDWNPLLNSNVINTLAVLTVNYCGADLKALCAETALIAVKRCYPQIYKSRQKLLLNIDKINIEMNDFIAAMKKLVPAAQRSSNSCARPLSIVVKPLLHRMLQKVVDVISEIYPAAKAQGSDNVPFMNFNDSYENVNFDDVSLQPLQWVGNFKPRLLIHGEKGQGHTTHLGAAILHHFESISHLKLDLPTLYSVSTRSPEESLANVFLEAYKRIPAIIYMPCVNKWWTVLSDTLRITLCTLIDEMESNIPILILATSDCHVDDLPEDLHEIFGENRSSKKLIAMSNPSRKERESFFLPLFENHIYRKPSLPQNSEELEELPLAPPPEPRQLSETELENLRKKEESTLRELRLFLRDVLGKLAKDRRFSIFVKPVDVEEVPDYLEVVKTPMALETMMAKIDTHQYHSTSTFLKDIDLICYNALEYNPDRAPTDKMIRHRACALKDSAYALIDEVQSDFEEQCKRIEERRSKRGDTPSKYAPPNYRTVPAETRETEKRNTLHVSDEDTEIESANDNGKGDYLEENAHCKKRNSRISKNIPKKLKMDDEESIVTVNGRKASCDSLQNVELPEVLEASAAPVGKVQAPVEEQVVIDRSKVSKLLEKTVEVTNGWNVEKLEELYTGLYRIINSKINDWVRTDLEKDIATEIEKFERNNKRSR